MSTPACSRRCLRRSFQQLRAVGRMVHFGVELDAPRLLALDVERRDAHVFRAGDDLIVRRNRRDRIAVRHPYLRGFGQAAHQRVVSIAHREHGAAVFTAGGGLHLAAEGRCEELRAVADAQQGQFALNGRKIGCRSVLVRTEKGLPDRITPRTEASSAGILLKGWISQ